MFRRAALTVPRTTRAYTDFHHREYPPIKAVTNGIFAIVLVGWVAFFAWGSVWWDSNAQWKKQYMSSWARRLPKGYVWADELPAEPVKNIYRNLPSSAE